MRVAAGIAVALVIAAAAGTASDAARQQREFGLFEVQLDGTGRRALLHNPAVRSVAEMSPDRKRILFIERSNPPAQESSLYSAAVDGSDVRLLASNTFVGAPAWSPDGRKIAFEGVDHARCLPGSTRCANGEIWVVNPDGTGLSRFVSHGIAPSWSPDSRRIAFVGYFNTYYERGVISVASVGDPGKIRELSPSEHQAWPEWKLTWSPRADRVTYAVERKRRSLVRSARMNARPQRGARTLLAGTGPTWAPNGKRLAFWTRDARRLYLVNPDGRRRRLLGRGMEPIWSPDGRWIAFTDDSPRGCFQVFVMQVTLRERHALTNEPCGAHFEIFWAPDSRRLYYASSVPG